MKKFLIIVAILGVVGIGGCVAVTTLFVGGAANAVVEASKEREEALKAKIASLADESQVSELSPSGELAQIYMLGSETTDLARDAKTEEILGKVVEWTLPVYDISKVGDFIRINTKGNNGDLVDTYVNIAPQSDSDNQYLLGLKEDDQVTFRGYIDSVSMRTINIEPAIIITD